VTTISTAQAGQPTRRRSQGLLWKLALGTLLIGGLVLAASVYLGKVSIGRLKEAVRAATGGPAEPVAEAPVPSPLRPTTWDDVVNVPRKDQQAIGFGFAPVSAQTESIKLELNGQTAYVPDTITKIRPRFDTLVEQVFATLGQRIKKGDPLVRLYSTDLAAAKTDFQTKYVQWQHDLKLKALREKLVASGAISNQLWVDTQNDEMKTRLDFTIVHDKLAVFYEIPNEEIEPLLEHLSDQALDQKRYGSTSDKAKMTMRCKIDGVVIERVAVPGNYYESTDVLMQIAPLERLWVWVNVFEVDQDKVRMGQTMEIHFPFLDQTISGKVDYVASEVSKDTRAVKVRATIPNPDGKFKSDMLVKALLEIPPVSGQTVVPRLAMVSISGSEYVFVRKTRNTSATDRPDAVDGFERRKIGVAQETTDTVVVARGLKAGEEVVTTGSLILSQLHEDQRMTSVGVPKQ
jgi:membrane fusion protein, heavy metal efflux system